jgi:hypothetical protein
MTKLIGAFYDYANSPKMSCAADFTLIQMASRNEKWNFVISKVHSSETVFFPEVLALGSLLRGA